MRYPPATADEGLISKTHTAQSTHNAERKQRHRSHVSDGWWTKFPPRQR